MFKNENFPVCLVVLKYFISPSSEIGYCPSVFAKKYLSKTLGKHLEEAAEISRVYLINFCLFSLLPARCSVGCNAKNGHCHKPNECM